MRNDLPAFCLLLASCLLLTSCENKISDLPVSSRGKPVPEEGVNILSDLSEHGVVKGQLTSPYMLRYPLLDSPYTEFPHSLHVDFFNDSMQIESKVDALYGKYLSKQDKVFLRDSVIVKNILKGDTLHCKQLWWDQASQRFYTSDSVRIYTKTQILWGTGMEADQNFRWYNIKNLIGSVLTGNNGVPK
ncbi:MAG: LPS export ABC transporter periplasmic protein LptC [Bacteroidota bacterium]|nr:LPS export ABC transporter periplasmic protein LptC [Bacteroidota bacterium]MDP4217387.1 LPS export ABC transporter periplasmic protein LptC [Bacteroidota bacterium]MDP4245721.1 LPS export ABC transporter periplasmic protein LptC [Bacteroidota bacterium]MDP4254256.1 LPS export ABC transporter periplasmic protein LptC [Bacteroidota bacterium]MDP4260719.1 LPS export ABC transporter periplasmic protein LptC [Bacteroidota bacterium]